MGGSYPLVIVLVNDGLGTGSTAMELCKAARLQGSDHWT